MVLYGLSKKYFTFLIPAKNKQLYDPCKLPIDEQEKLCKHLEKLYPDKASKIFLSGEMLDRFNFVFNVLKVAKMSAANYFKPTRIEITKKRREFVYANIENPNIVDYTI